MTQQDQHQDWQELKREAIEKAKIWSGGALGIMEFIPGLRSAGVLVY